MNAMECVLSTPESAIIHTFFPLHSMGFSLSANRIRQKVLRHAYRCLLWTGFGHGVNGI